MIFGPGPDDRGNWRPYHRRLRKPWYRDPKTLLMLLRATWAVLVIVVVGMVIGVW